MNRPGNRGQAFLDFAFVFLAIAVLSVGIVRIWVWYNTNYAHRQRTFQDTRAAAGQPDLYLQGGVTDNLEFLDGDKFGTHPYQPIDLTEDWVFRGVANGLVGGGTPDGNYVSPTEECRGQHPECFNPAHPGDPEYYDYTCAGFVHCMCMMRMQARIEQYRDNADSLDGQATTLERSAQTMEDTAEECDDWWEFCSWFGGRKTARELRAGARDLRNQAARLRAQATELRNKANDIVNCCENYNTENSQRICIENITNTNSTEGCLTAVGPYLDDFDTAIRLLEDQRTGLQTRADEAYNTVATCNTQAVNTCQTRCQRQCNGPRNWIGPPFSDGECYTQCNGLCVPQATNECTFLVDHDNNPSTPDIPILDPDCYEEHYDSCYSLCYYGPNGNNGCYRQHYDACYPACYENERNSCCNSSSGRNCDTPVTLCDGDCFNDPAACGCVYRDVHWDCPRCGLSEMARRIVANEISGLTSQIGELQSDRGRLVACCNILDMQGQPDMLGRITCIMDIVNEYDLGG